MGYEIFDRTNYRESTPTPKVGLAWEPVPGNRVRLAAFRSLKRALVVDQGLEPTQLVGFNQFYDEFDGSKVDEIALGFDLRPLPTLSVGAEITRAWASPVNDQVDIDDTDIILGSRDEYGFGTYAYWTATDRLAINGQVRLSRLDQADKDAGTFPTRIDTLLVPVEARYFLFPSGFFGQARVSFLHQKVERGDASGLPEGSDGSFLVDLGVGYRIPGRHGILSVQVANLFDQHISYQDDTFRSTEQPSATYLPSRTLMVQASLQF
jgi:outer membrane receptor protein involved in Fe transport